MPAVSIIVPNYNHARYLKQRLDGIVHQTFRDWELIILDDASTDDSLVVIERYARRDNVRVVRNEQNSGSPFKQWLKGLALAQADLVWIAESDDACEPNFLDALLPAFRRPEVKLAYANSTILDAEGKTQGDYSKVDYLTSLSPRKWARNYVVSAADEVNQGFGVKNTILSASSVVFRKFPLPETLQGALQTMRLAGDWLFFAHAALGGSIWYDARPLNAHRRHKESVIATAVADNKLRDFFAEFRTVQEFIFERYPLGAEFEAKWEQYLRSQWRDFCPGKPFEELAQYYPFEDMRALIRKAAPQAPQAERAAPGTASIVQENPAPRAPVPAPSAEPGPVLAIGHDACLAGAQMVLLTALQEWQRTKPFPVRLILGDGGGMRKRYEAACPTLVLSDYKAPGQRKSALERFLTPRPRIVYSNTVANGPLLEELRWLGVPVVTHVHELQKSIERWAPGEIMASTLRRSNHLIACSNVVADNLRANHGVMPGALSTIYEFIPLRGAGADPARLDVLRRELRFTGNEIVVFGCGHVDTRKGADLYVTIATQAIKANQRLRFVWIGEGPDRKDLQGLVRARKLDSYIRFLGEKPSPRDYLPLGKIFLLPSREDPFPLVALEAADAGLPIVCFADSGGMPFFVADECGRVVPFEDTQAATQAVLRLAKDENKRRRLSAKARHKVAEHHSSTMGAASVAALLLEKSGGEAQAVRTVPADPGAPAVLLRNDGYCPTCPGPSTFIATNAWFRDHYRCGTCSSLPRERALMHVIDTYYPDWKDLVIHESSPGDRGASVRLKRECTRYLPTWFFPDRKPGSVIGGQRCENLEAMTFKDASIDLHVTQDVMEHVFDPDKVFREIARTLKPGGAHICTVPLVFKARPSRRRARLRDGKIELLVEPPEYHGDPINEKGALVTFDWGYDICRRIFDACGLFTQIIYIDDLSKGIRAEYIEVLMTLKPGTPKAQQP